jgi:ectoine hydroxylase-related dioxygenase (phytanoyl-CoA dioxygenase family)
MTMMDVQLKQYVEDGFVVLPSYFSKAEVEIMKAELPALFGEDSPRRVVEKRSNIVRSVYGSHTTNQVFHDLSRLPRLVEPARQVLGSEVYVYQFKINAKAAFGGDVWEWHQDYIFWRNEDRLPTPRVTSIAIYLDDVTEFNGPMFVIPGSHRRGVIEVPARGLAAQGDNQIYKNSPDWIANLTADLKYSIALETLRGLIEDNGIVSMKAPAGSAFFFDGNLVHGSSTNISPYSRALVIITYNSVENVPLPVEKPRPAFLVSRDCTPVVALADDLLLRRGAVMN